MNQYESKTLHFTNFAIVVPINYDLKTPNTPNTSSQTALFDFFSLTFFRPTSPSYYSQAKTTLVRGCVANLVRHFKRPVPKPDLD